MRSWFANLWDKLKGCEHDYTVVYQDNAVSVEVCTKCNDEVRYGC